MLSVTRKLSKSEKLDAYATVREAIIVSFNTGFNRKRAESNDNPKGLKLLKNVFDFDKKLSFLETVFDKKSNEKIVYVLNFAESAGYQACLSEAQTEKQSFHAGLAFAKMEQESKKLMEDIAKAFDMTDE
jgi:superfamily II DNA helicase RecQ